MWPLLIMGAMSMMQQSQARNGQAAEAAGETKAIQAANVKNFTNTTYRAGLLNVQKAQQLKGLQQAKADLGVGELAALSTAGNNAAASGTVGASVDAVQTDIEMAYDKQRALISEENEQNAQNFNTELYDLITNGSNSINFGRKTNYASDFQIAASTAIGVGAKYASAKMDLGLGTQRSQA